MSEAAPDSKNITENDVTSSLLSAAELSVERQPILQVFFENVCSELVGQFQKLSDATTTLTLERVWTGNIEAINVSDENHVVVQLDVHDKDQSAYLTLDRSGLYLLLEYMLGAGGTEKPYLEEKEFTVLEYMIAKAIANRAGLAFCHVFSEVVDITMTAKDARSGSEISEISTSDESFLIANIVLDVFDRSGSLNILIPQSVLSPIKSRFVDIANLEIDASDSIWTEHIQSQLQHTDMECWATLDGGQITLGDVSKLKVGQLLDLAIAPDSPVRLSSQNQDLFWCELGQADGAFNLKITERGEEQTDLLDMVLKSRDLNGPNNILVK